MLGLLLVVLVDLLLAVLVDLLLVVLVDLLLLLQLLPSSSWPSPPSSYLALCFYPSCSCFRQESSGEKWRDWWFSDELWAVWVLNLS